jgi:hypothetical protein
MGAIAKYVSFSKRNAWLRPGEYSISREGAYGTSSHREVRAFKMPLQGGDQKSILQFGMRER